MKISIGLRLFLVVLISIISVVALSLFVMREKVAQSFSTYAVQIELDRLQGLTQDLQHKYATNKNWSFIDDAPNKRSAWIKQELTALYLQANQGVSTAGIANPNSADISKGQQVPPANGGHYQVIDSHLPPLPQLPPPAPPEPPAPPAPPAPPEIGNRDGGRLSSINRTQQIEAKISKDAPTRVSSSSINSSDFYDRIRLIDADKRYLAGNPLMLEPSTARPIIVDDKTVGFIVISHPQLPSDTMAKEFIEAQKESIALILVVAVILSGLIASVLARYFRLPIQQLVLGAEQLELGNFDHRLEAHRKDELGRLAHSFNQLAHKLGQVEQQRRQWVADTSHELRTPLSVLRAQLEALQDGIRPSTPENLALLHRQVMSLNKLIDELYTLARADIGELDYQFKLCDLNSLLRETTKSFEDKFSGAGLSYELQTPNGARHIDADAERLRQVFSNLFENSIRYTEAPGQIRIKLIKDTPNVGGIKVIIEDSAPTVSERALLQLGERFFRVDGSRSRESGGVGLGLALCKRIVAAHHGRISFCRSELGGLKVEILFDQKADQTTISAQISAQKSAQISALE